MGLFGNDEEKVDVEMEIMTNNTWLAGKPTPKAIIRNLPNGGNGHTFEYFKAKGCNYVYPCIQMKNCVKIVETKHTDSV